MEGKKHTCMHTSWSIGQEKVLPTRISHYIPRQSSVKIIKEVSERTLIGIENSKWHKKCSESCIKLLLRESILSNTFTGPLESVQMGSRKK